MPSLRQQQQTERVCKEPRKARMKSKTSRYIVIINRLTTPTWLKQLNKSAGCILIISAYHSFWSATNFEPLYVSILFLILNTGPFNSKQHQKCSRWVGDCQRYFKRIKWMGGIFCKLFTRHWEASLLVKEDDVQDAIPWRRNTFST